MTKEEITIGMVLLRNRPNYSYVMVEKDGDVIKYEVVESGKSGEAE